MSGWTPGLSQTEGSLGETRWMHDSGGGSPKSQGDVVHNNSIVAGMGMDIIFGPMCKDASPWR